MHHAFELSDKIIDFMTIQNKRCDDLKSGQIKK